MGTVGAFMRDNWGWILSFLGFVTGLCTWAIRQLRAQKTRMQALERGVQALLRSQMHSEYEYWQDRGYAPIYARENFNNLWSQYETLGPNNVMNDIYRRFMELPTEEGTK